MSKLSGTDGFVGFGKTAMQFWRTLESEMSKEWFAANKQRYEDEWVTPTTALLEQVARTLASTYSYGLKPPKLLRIYRDVRFSKDKAPYKTHINALLEIESKKENYGGIVVVYLQLGLPKEFVASGCYEFDASQLAKWRRAVDGKAGEEIQGIATKLRKAGYVVGGPDNYKRVPKGFDEGHPRAEFLKMKGLIGDFPQIPTGLVREPGFAEWTTKHAKAMAPLVMWLHHNIG